MTMSNAVAKLLPAAQGARQWRPSTGHTYHQPPTTRKEQDSTVSTPAPAAASAKPAPSLQNLDEASLDRAAEEAFILHMRHGGEFIDENPITGRPGEFHLSSTGRKPPVMASAQQAAVPGRKAPVGINTNVGGERKDKEKTPKSATALKPKRRKSKMTSTPAGTTPAATTPAA